MYNLNNSGLTPNPPVSKPTDNTPQTPEILNLISCTNPFDNYPPFQTSTGGKLVEKGSNGGSSPPQSVQHTCSQIIKEGLKLALQTKRRSSYSSCSDSYYGVGGAVTKDLTEMSRDSVEDEDDDDQSSCISNGEGLTVEDEERRRRRRERNKIAATKCRLKKRERTVNLVHESEILETQNHDLKSQIQELESQRRRLVDMLSVHKPCCTKKDGVQFSMEPVSIPFIQPFQTSGSHSSSVHSSLSGGSAHSNSLSNVHSSTSGSILSSGSVTTSSVHSSSNLSSGSLHSITSGSLHSSSNMTSSLHSSSNMSSGSLHSTSNMTSGNVHDSSNRDRMTQKDQTLSFPTTDSMHLYDDSDLSTGQCSGSNLHDLDSTYDMSGEVKDIMLPFCASTEALSLGLHYDDEFINNYDPSLWHRPDSVTYRTSFQETYRACANNNNLVSHSKTKDGRAVSKQCADDHEGLLNE